MPSFVGNFTRLGRPLASKPSSQLVFTYGLPLRNSPVVAIEHVHHAVAVGPQHDLARLALPLDVGEHRHLRRVVVQLVVRRELVVPLQLAGVGVERDDAVAVEVVAKPRRAVPVRRRVAGAEEHEVRLGIVGARVPHADAAGLPRVARPGLVARLAGSGNRVEAPDFLAGLRIERRDVAADRAVAAAGADDHLVLHDRRVVRDRVAAPSASATCDVPDLLAALRVDRDQVRVERAHDTACRRGSPRRG